MPEIQENQAKIAEHREQIDALDVQIVALLNERAGHSLAIRALKPGAKMGLYDPRREEEILEKLRAVNDGPMYNDDLDEIYGTILKVMKEIRA